VDSAIDPVKAKAVLVDPATWAVVWANESAAGDFSAPGAPVAGVAADEALPMTGAVGVTEAARAVAADGETRHLRTKLVSTTKGSMEIATSIYRLADGLILVLTENAWQSGRETTPSGPSRRGARRAR